MKTDDLFQAITTLGPQDVIINDGGHTNMMQQTSLRVLFPYVRPGGIYILDDLQVSFWGAGDNPHGITMVDYITICKGQLQNCFYNSISSNNHGCKSVFAATKRIFSYFFPLRLLIVHNNSSMIHLKIQ